MTKVKSTTEQFILKATQIHSDKYDYSKTRYVKSNLKVIIICLKHGEFLQIPNNHLRGAGCLKCKYENLHFKRKRSLKEFIELTKEVHGDKYNYSNVNYVNNRTKIKIICPKHGEFLLTPHDHLNGCGCPKCRTSFQQLKLYNKLCLSFPFEKILYEVGKKAVNWIGNLRFDIYFPKYNIAIEYNGELHYVPVKHFGGQICLLKTKERDLLKHNKCIQNNCILFEIRYNYSTEDYLNLIKHIKLIINNYESNIR